MADFYEIKDPVLGTSVYVDGVLCGKNVNITLPPATRKVVEYSGLGFEIPLPGLYENSRMKISHIGVDMGLARLAGDGQTHTYEVRFCLNVVSAGGKTRRVGCNAFINGAGVGLPEVTLETGSTTDTELEVAVLSQKLVVDGETIYDIDRTGGTAQIGGADELNEIEAYL